MERSHNYKELGAIVIVVATLFLVLNKFQIIPDIGINEQMTYGFIFLIGLVAAVSSCIAVTGGLLLAISARHRELNPHLTSLSSFKPHIYFNIGRIISYTVFGGLIGAIGSSFTFNAKVSGIITILASLAMVIAGFQLIHIFPSLKKINLGMPKFLALKVIDSKANGSVAQVLLGAGTFFLPCGFTQSLQLYTLAQGDPLKGALTMLVFSLGTLPALISIGALSSYIKGNAQSYFMKFAGVLIIILGIANIKSGLVLTGFRPAQATQNYDLAEGKKMIQLAENDPNVSLVNGVQQVKMTVKGYEYYPSRFTVKKDLPVEWLIDGTQAAGCARILIAPKAEVFTQLDSGINKVVFTPTETGAIPFSCSMGMTTPGAQFIVIN